MNSISRYMLMGAVGRWQTYEGGEGEEGPFLRDDRPARDGPGSESSGGTGFYRNTQVSPIKNHSDA